MIKKKNKIIGIVVICILVITASAFYVGVFFLNKSFTLIANSLDSLIIQQAVKEIDNGEIQIPTEKPNASTTDNPKTTNDAQPKPQPKPDNTDKTGHPENVSIGEKAEVTKLVLSKFSADEVSTLRGYLDGGLTKDEKKQIKTLVYSRFNSDEIAYLKAMYDKYYTS